LAVRAKPEKRMLGRIANAVNTKGFAIIRGHAPESSGRTALSQLGEIVKLPGICDVQVLAPRRTDESPPNIYSGNFGCEEFPLHTDLAHWSVPPKYLALRCVAGTNDVATRIFDSRELVSTLGSTTLRRALVQPRRPINRARPLLRLLENGSTERWLFRWDRLFVVPATPESSLVCEAVGEYLSLSTAAEIVLVNPGDTLIIDNWRMLHGRSAVGATALQRRIERTYFGALNEQTEQPGETESTPARMV
jgi:L-asparagine oxygenase